MSPGDAAGRLRARRLDALRAAMSAEQMAAAQRSADDLSTRVRHPSQLADTTVLVAYGGGKDSSFTLAFVRAMQLLLFAAHGSTFVLRAVTNRHAGMPWAVLANIDRAYRALGLNEDPSCEALLVDGDEVKPFRRDEPLPARVVQRNRLDLLMTGHRTLAEARPTFCNACNLSMINALGLAASYGRGVDVIITGDSPEEQRLYYLWVNRLARRFRRGVEKPGDGGFRRFLSVTNDIAQTYFTDIYGPGADEIAQRRVAHEVPSRLQFFSIFDYTDYASSSHWRLLTECLGFEFDELAFSFTESDCGSPTLMAHLRGLKCERLYGRSYRDGLHEYVDFACSLMRRKEFPEWLIGRMRDRYAGAAGATGMRARANQFAMDAYGLTEEQLICMVYAPLAGGGERIELYLEREQPRLVPRVRDIHALLDGRAEPDAASSAELASALEALTGLELQRLRVLYRSVTIKPSESDGRAGIVGAILSGDPHKQVIETRHSRDGDVVRELLSGR